MTDAYLSRCVAGIRYFRPGVPVVALVPPPYDAAYHAHVTRLHGPAAAAAKAWGRREAVPMVPVDEIVAPYLAAGRLNPDGMHWSWEAHADVGAAVAEVVRAAGWSDAIGGNRPAAGTVSPT